MKLVPALLLAALMSVSASAADNVFTTHRSTPVVGQTIGFSLHHDSCGCSTCNPTCAAPSACCEPTCAAPASSCCNSCEPTCAAPAACGNACGNACCEPTCAAPASSCCNSCEPTCAAPAACCEPSCAAPCNTCGGHEGCGGCCQPKKKSCFDKIMDIERRKNKWLLGLIGR